MYLWFTPQGWVQRTLPGEIPRYQKKKKKTKRERQYSVPRCKFDNCDTI